MAAHGRPRRRSLGGHTARAVATIALAGAASGTGYGTGHAEPQLSPAQVKARVDTLYQEAEAATQKYDGAKGQADKAQQRLNGLKDEAARRAERLNSARDALGSAAAAQYRDGGIDPSVRLLLSSDPGQYLDDVAFAERADNRQAAAMTRVRQQLREIERLRGAARVELTSLRSRQAELRRQKRTITEKLGEARRLLSQLTRGQRAQLTADGGGQASRSALGDLGRVSASAAAAQAPNARAAAALAYAYDKLGSPYVWGATGPKAFDCSGLVQAAYRSAGIALPRTTYAQIDAGRRVSRSELLPGDLVFFYSGVSHVGIYVGHGQMIHAPNPSAPVRLAPIDEMPLAGATRVV